MNTASVVASVSRTAGGLFESCCRLHQCLLHYPGIKVTVAGLDDEFSLEDKPKWSPVPVETFPKIGPAAFGYAPGLKELLREQDYDLAHTHGLWMYPSVAVHAWHKKTGRPYVVSPHGMLDPWAVRNSGWKKRIALAAYERTHLRDAACIRALCQSEAESIRAFGLKNPICVIPNGVDLPGGEEQCRSLPFESGGRKVLLYLGRIHPKKGLSNLLRAWADPGTAAIRQSNRWVLAIAGWDQSGYEAELKDLANELGLRWSDVGDGNTSSGATDSLVFLGPQFNEDKAACYRSCDAFILPSVSEGLPMVVLEAWAYGKPVLMTSRCNLPEGFAAGAAWEISGDVPALATKIQELIEIPESDRIAAGCRGRALVQNNFAWNGIAQQMRDVYSWLVGGGQRPVCVQP